MTPRTGTRAKGQRLQLLAKRALEAVGWRVELARPRIVWIPQDGRSGEAGGGRYRVPLRRASRAPAAAASGVPAVHAAGRLRPISVGEDLFGVFDGVAVAEPDIPPGLTGYSRERYVCFFQVTDVANVSHRRAKLLASRFPADGSDVLLGFVGGRGRQFRVLRGPMFEWRGGETLAIAAEAK